jgi:hypothetical protein
LLRPLSRPPPACSIGSRHHRASARCWARPVDEDELYVALDWLGERQEASEKACAQALHHDTRVLYDVSWSYVEGRCHELARLGYNRDGKKGKLQIVYGLLCAAEGFPVAIRVFDPCGGRMITALVQVIGHTQEIVNIIEILAAE